MPVELASPRLLLRLRTAAEVRSLLDGLRPPGVRWAPGYPLDGSLVSAAMQAELHDHGVDVGCFGQFQIIRRLDAKVIGDIGFHAPPDELGEVGVGFGIVRAARGQGYATEALLMLLDWALAQPEVRSVHADTDFVNLASHRVLSAAGMELVADLGDRRLYEIHGVRA